MEWYQVVVVLMLGWSFVSSFSHKSFTGTLIHWTLIGVWVWCLKAGNFFA